MGISQSLDVLFGSPSLQTDSEQANVYQYLQRVEKTLWVATPWWEQGPLNDNGVGGGDSEVHTPSKRRDPFKKLTPGEALALIPGLLDDAWVSPLVALTDCVDPIARSTGIALLSRIVHKDSVAKIFLAVDGMTKMVALLDSQDEHNIHLALECIFTLCAGRPNVVLPFCEAGLIGRLTTLAKGDNVELVLASLKVLRLTLHQSAVKAEVSHRKFVPVLMELVHSAHAMIAKTAVICIGLSLPNAENLAEISRLGCIDAFLRLMTPANPSVDAVIFALSLVADETDTIFPREQTTTTLTRMLETLRGGAKRSASASATSYLFASLAKSSIFHAAICTEPNLGILAKLLVGGSSGVLTATAYALGIVAINANDRVRHMLFEVGAPQNLLQLVKLSVASSSPGRDEKVARLAIFALANVMNEALVSHAGALVRPDLHLSLSANAESLRASTSAGCTTMQSTEFLSYVHDRAITNLGTGSTYSLKLLAALNTVQRVKELLCKAASVARLLEYLRGASAAFLPTLLIILLECCSCDDKCACEHARRYKSVLKPQEESCAPGSSLAFCKLVEMTPDALKILGALFQNHPPEHLLGLSPLLAALAAHSSSLKAQMSASTFFIDQTVSVATRLNVEALHEQVLGFLDRLTALKNTRALEQLFSCDPDRIANLLQASSSTEVQLLAATLLRRLFKRLNSHDIPSRAAQRHLIKLLSASGTSDLVVAVAACRVWGNLFQYEDKRIAFTQTTDAVAGLLVLLQRSIGQTNSASGERLVNSIQELNDNIENQETMEKCCVPSELKPLYWVIRSIFRMSCCEVSKQAIVVAPHFLCIAELFPFPCDPIACLAIDTMSELANTPCLRRTLAVPAILNAIQQLLRDHDRVASGNSAIPQRHALRLLGLLARKDPAIQHLVVESRLLEALLLLLESPPTTRNADLLVEGLDALAWVCSAARSPIHLEVQAEIEDDIEIDTPINRESPARRVVATHKMIEFSLCHTDSALAPVTRASLHLLQRLACEQPAVPQFVFDVGGADVIMSALQQRTERSVRRRACGLVQNLVHRHDGNRQQFQELGAINFLVTLVTASPENQEPEEENTATRKLQIKGLQALAGLCEGTTAAARACKQELLECEHSALLLRLVGADDTSDERLCAVWIRALSMAALASSTNQRRLVKAGIVPLVTKLLQHSSGRVRVPAAQLLACVAQIPENRGIITNEGGESLLKAIINALQSELPGLQRYAALFIAHAATRHEGNKVRLGAAGAASPLVDRLSSQRLHVLENVLLAVVKLGSHAGNKVKLGGKVCFDKLLTLVHNETLAVAKGAARALAVLVVGNDANKRFLLQCESPVVAELTALLKGLNGTIVESAMLILGELAPMPAQALELSRCVDVLSVVRLLTHVNPRIARAALLVVCNLTRESFNKTRFGLSECMDALLTRLRLGINGTSGADELELVELTITCLANLSFIDTNASQIVEAKNQHGGSLVLFLQLVAMTLPASIMDYLSVKEISSLMIRGDISKVDLLSECAKLSPTNADSNDEEGHNRQQEEPYEDEVNSSLAGHSPKKTHKDKGGAADHIKSDEHREAETEFPSQDLNFAAFPSLQTTVLEQALLVLSNCGDQYRTAGVVDTLAVAIICQALRHTSELVTRCACYTLACWIKRHHALQDAATKRGALPPLSKLLTSTNHAVVEAAAYVLSKLAAYGDNAMKLLALDVPATLVHGILRQTINVPHDRVLDRAVRLLGTLAQFPRVRQALKGEEIIADVLTPLLQLHPQALGKNLSRFVLALLADDSLKFFLPKKTVSLLRACFVHQASSTKTIRNVLRIFSVLVAVEEHKTTIALEDSGEAVSRMVQELRIADGLANENDDTALGLLAHIAGTRKIAVILHENDVYAKLPAYLTVSSPHSDSSINLSSPTEKMYGEVYDEHCLHGVQIAARLCKTLGEQAIVRLSELEFTSVLLAQLRAEVPFKPPPEAEEADSMPQTEGELAPLSPVAWECIDVLRQLCPSSYDEQIVVEEGGVGIIVEYVEAWFAVASGIAPTQFPSKGDDGLVTSFAVSLAAIIRILSTQTLNREILVQAGGYSLILKVLDLGPAELPDAQRGQFAEALAGLSSLPIVAQYLEAAPELVTLLFRFMVAPQTQQISQILLLALHVFADVMETSPASRAYVLTISGGTIQPLPFLLRCLECSNGNINDESTLKLMHTMRSLQRLVMDANVADAMAFLEGVPAIGRLMCLALSIPTAFSDRLEMIQLMATDALGYLAFFGHAPQLRLERPAVARLLAQTDFSRNERVRPDGIATSVRALMLLATPHLPSSTENAQAAVRAEVEATATRVRTWVWQDTHGLDVLIECGLRAPDFLNLPSSVKADVLAVLTTATEQDSEAETVLAQLVQKRVCTPVAALLESVEPHIRRPALQLLARLLKKQIWASEEPSLRDIKTTNKREQNTDIRYSNDADDIPGECWSIVLLHLTEWMQVYAQDPPTTPVSELRDAYWCLSVLTAHKDLAVKIGNGTAPRGLMDLVASALQYFGSKRLPSRPESLVMIRKMSVSILDTTDEELVKADEAAERAKTDWQTQFDVILHALRVCRRLMSFSLDLSVQALMLRVSRTLDNLVLLHDRYILDEALRCMLHLATLHGKETELLFSSDRTIARLKALLQSESRPLQARITPILALMAANMSTLPGLCGMDGVLILVDLAVSSSSDHLFGMDEEPSLVLNRRVFEDACSMLLAIFACEESVVLAFDVAEVVPKLFDILERMAATCVLLSQANVAEAPELFNLSLHVLAKIATAPTIHMRFIDLLPRICRLLDGENGPAKLASQWCELLLSVLFNVFGCPYGSRIVSAEWLAQGKQALLPQLLPLDRWLPVAKARPTLGRFVIELIRAFVGNGELTSPYAAIFNNGEDIPAILTLVGYSHEEVAIPAAQLLLAITKQRDVRVGVVVADGVPVLVIALREATSIKVQNLVLSLLLELSRGDTEVQAILLSAPGCIERLIEFVQVWVDTHNSPNSSPNKKEAVRGNTDRRLALSCTLLTELSRALRGPERIVEANGHIPLLALSIHQQHGEDLLGAQTTVQILTNIAVGGVAVAPGLAASKLPAHFLSCVLLKEIASAGSNENHAMPHKWQLALNGLLALAKASRDLRADLAKSAPLVKLLEISLQPEQKASTKRSETQSGTSRDALMLLYLLSTVGSVEMAGHSSPEMLSRLCGVINQHMHHITEDGGVPDEETIPMEVTCGLKLLANLLDVADQHQIRLTWHPEKLLDLKSLLEMRVAAHSTPKKQLPALRVVRGAYALGTTGKPPTRFYFPLSPKLLAELLTVILVSASRQHHETAVQIIVCAFKNDPERARTSVGDNQILEQLLIVFTQAGTDASERASELAIVLTQVLYVSISRVFVVGQRFLAKLPVLLASFPTDCSASEDQDFNQLKRALSIYLAFVYSSNPPKSAARSAISDMLRSEGDSRRALGILLEQVLLIHSNICLSGPDDDGNTAKASSATLSTEDILLWTCIVESISPVSPTLAELFLAHAPVCTWYCVLRDWFHQVTTLEQPIEETVRNSCRMLSVLAHLPAGKEEEDALVQKKCDLCAQCLAVLSSGRDSLTPQEIEGSLQALMDARERWGDSVVLSGCSAFVGTAKLLPRLLQIFHFQEREADTSRHLVLQLLVLLASTDHFVEEIKAAGVRSAVENNPLISAEDKALPVALLGMLGYNSDLNEEFAQALAKFNSAKTAQEQCEHVAYLLRFLERYSLTHAPTKERAINSFMIHLVADAEKTQTALTAFEHGPEEANAADKLSYTIACDCLSSLVKLVDWNSTPGQSHPSSNFGELYLAHWDLNALLAVAFARQKGDEDNEFQEKPRLTLAQITQVLELAAIVRSKLDHPTQRGDDGAAVVGQIDRRWIYNAFALVNSILSPSRDDLLLVDHVLDMLHWLSVSSVDCFADVCRYAGLLKVFLAPLKPIFCGDELGGSVKDDAGNRAMEIFLTLVEMVVNTPPAEAEATASADEQLIDLLKFIYEQVDNNLRQEVRSRLMLCVLVLLKRAGDAGRGACVAYERAIQQILWHIHSPSSSEIQARCSWELLGSLSELDPAITALFNLDAIPVLLRECGCGSSPQQIPTLRSWRVSKRAAAFRQAEALKCLSRAARTHDEVLFKVGEASGIAAILFGALSSGTSVSTNGIKNTNGRQMDRAGTQAHAAHLISRIAAQEDLRASLVSPENISLLIESLESVHLPVVLHALQALAHLCSFALCLDALVRHATVPVLAQILFSPLAATIRRREIESCVLALLSKMCARSQIVSRRVVSSNLLPKLQDFLVVEKQQREYTGQEAPRDDFEVFNNAVWVVSSLSEDPELVSKLAAHGILETLCDQLLAYDQSTTQCKALGAMSRLVSAVDMDIDLLQSIIDNVVESVRRNVPVPAAHRVVGNALGVIITILKTGKNNQEHTQQQQRRPQSQQRQRKIEKSDAEINFRQVVLQRDGLRVALELLGATDSYVKLQAFIVVSEFVENHPDPMEVRELLLGSEEQGGSHALLSLVRVISDEARSTAAVTATDGLASSRNRDRTELLRVVLALLNMLITDDTLKMKLTPTTYDMVLQVVVATSTNPAPTSYQQRVLAESLKALTTMTRAGQIAELCPEAALVSSVDALVKVLRSSPAVAEISAGSTRNLLSPTNSSNTAARLNALFLLVNFASSALCRSRMARCGALEALLGIIQEPGGVSSVQDDQLVQLALLGVALMTTDGVTDAAAVVELSGAVDTLVRLLSSRSPSTQANAVWVVSNISSEATLKNAIIARGGPTALQSMLSDTMNTIAATSNGGGVAASRPSSSALRIREYAPKAIKALGFAPILPIGPGP